MDVKKLLFDGELILYRTKTITNDVASSSMTNIFSTTGKNEYITVWIENLHLFQGQSSF